MADASSRARFALIDSISTHFGINHRRVDIPTRARGFLEAVRADARLRLATTGATERGAAAGTHAAASFGAAARDGASSSPATSSPRP